MIGILMKFVPTCGNNDFDEEDLPIPITPIDPLDNDAPTDINITQSDCKTIKDKVKEIIEDKDNILNDHKDIMSNKDKSIRKKILRVKYCDDNDVKEWTEKKDSLVLHWKHSLEYQQLMNTLILSELKEKESYLTWIIIVISTMSSSLSIIQFGDNEYQWLEIYLHISLSISTIITTLIAAWLKKNNYVERINNTDRYLQKVSRISVEIVTTLAKDKINRMSYSNFEEKYQDTIFDLISDPPDFSPYEYKKSLYKLTKYYPELLTDKYPWYNLPEKTKSSFGKTITDTYKELKYYTCLSKLTSLYFCKCKCCCRKNVNQFDKATSV